MKQLFAIALLAGIGFFFFPTHQTFAKVTYIPNGGRKPTAHITPKPKSLFNINYGCNNKWKNVMAYYNNPKGTDQHTITTEEDTLHTGCDVVFGNANNATQRFVGWEYGNNGQKVKREVEVTKWILAPDNATDDSDCPDMGNNYVKKLIQNASDTWGSYWVPGADYCTYTKDWTIKFAKFVHKTKK